MKRKPLSVALAAALLFGAGSTLAATFTYHGTLLDSGKPAEGTYDIELTLYTAPSGGHVIGGPMVMFKVPVHEGRFSTQADFGPLTKSVNQAYVSVRVRSANQEDYVSLNTRALVDTVNATSVCPGAWTLEGNAGNPAGSYLGTADTQPLTFDVNATQVGQITPSGDNAAAPNSPDVVFGSSSNSVVGSIGGATIAGGGDQGFGNSVHANFATVGGGVNNTAQGTSSTVGGGQNITASGNYSVVSGGYGNAESADYSTISGGIDNTASGGSSTVAGGTTNMASGGSSTIGGGFSNIASGSSSIVAGGYTNTASEQSATVAGGQNNTATAGNSAIGGGFSNIASGPDSIVAGGYTNTASGQSATVAGGQNNTASGAGSTVAGGFDNNAAGQQSFAAGTLATVRSVDDGTFVWADNIGSFFTSTGPNQFLVRATGGVGINTADLGLPASLTVQGLSNTSGTLTLVADSSKGTNQSNIHYGPTGDWFIRSASGSGNVVIQDTGGGVGIGTSSISVGDLITTGANGAHLTSGGVWTSASGRTFKEAFANVDVSSVLTKVVALPVQTWFYKIDHAEGRHMGPMAEDFSEAFGLGSDDQHVGSVDESGVALAAIQGLNQKLEAENAALKAEKDAEVSELQRKLDDVLARLSTLEGKQGD